MVRRAVDQLTPRESQVLDLVAHGLTNEEIALKLGVSLDGAKYHVSQILSKLGVETREQASALRRLERRTPRWAMLPVLVKVGGAALLVATGVGLGAFGYAVLSTDGSAERQENLPFGVAPEYEYDGHGPHVGDHWEIGYSAYAGNQRIPWSPPFTNAPMTTDHDSAINIDPEPGYEGEALGIDRFFAWGGGVLTRTAFRMPGTDKTYHDREIVPDEGKPGHIYIVRSPGPIGVCGRPVIPDDYEFVAPEYVPHDGECIRLYFESAEGLRDNFVRYPLPAGELDITPPAASSAP